MFYHNLLILFRTFLRQRVYSIITLSGVIIGLTAVMLAFVVIADEIAYDKFHSKADQIFRINKIQKSPSGDISKNAESPGLMAAALKSDFPEVITSAHMSPWFDDVLISYENQNITINNWVFADPNFFNLFDFEILEGGDPRKLLSQPGQVLLTSKVAETLFSNENPIGKTFKGIDEQLYNVAGIIANAPRQSHIQYDAIASWASTEAQSGVHDFNFMNNWLGQTVYTYVQLHSSDQVNSINSKLPEFTARHMPNRVDAYDFYLQPLEDIYLNSFDLLFLRGGKYGSATFLRTFGLITLLILLTACFNYINITTARSIQRTKEVGVKKVLGASNRNVIYQFLTETFGITTLAAIVVIPISQFLLPQLNIWFDKDIPNSILISPQSLGFLLIVIIITSLVSGLFPALLLSKFRPIGILQSQSKSSPGGRPPRSILTTLQLAVSIGLIAGTLILRKQFDFLINRDLGIDKEQVLVMHTPPGINSSVTAFRNEIESLNGVTSVSICNAAMPEGTFGSTVLPEGSVDEVPVQVFRVDSQYLKTYGITMAEGRFINRSSDEGSLVVNETMVNQMGWEKGLGKTVRFINNERLYPIVGVVKDFNYNSLHQPINPLIMYLDDRRSNISVRMDVEQSGILIPQLKELWETFEARHPFDYYFLDDFFALNYLKEKQMTRVISLFAAIAILIACLGLYGLVSFEMIKRRKEIGIRKVLGASVTQITKLLIKSFVFQLLIGMMIAIPVVWYIANMWLQDFTYHISLNIWVFVLAGISMLSIVMLTIGFQSINAATANPTNSLRSE